MRELLDAAPAEISVDLEAQTIVMPDGRTIEFPVDPKTRENLLNGWDDIGLVLRHADKIRDFEARRLAEQPWLGKSLGA